LLTGNVLDVSPVQSSLGFDAPAAKAEPEVAIGPAQSSLSGFDVQQPLRSTRPGTRDVTDRHGQLQIEKLFEHFPRLRLVNELAERHRFFHWELTFADIFYAPREIPPDPPFSKRGVDVDVSEQVPPFNKGGLGGISRGGFDLILGNPPWLKVEWEEGGVLGDINPLFVLRKFSATKLAQAREDAFKQHEGLETAYFAELEQAEATQNFLNAMQNYP
ncbi:MAG: hypothetical protein KDJ28_18765, partial [Candidatus Competibacteraceae bacterium]|nr:hypothetical protein [Candidatus Competibacteraceae bacterium]